MKYFPASCLVLFFLFSLFHPLSCASSKQELGECATLFQCGNTTVGFPYWGGKLRKRCGHPLLELQCIEDITYLAILNHLYRVLHIDQTSNTLKLSIDYSRGSFCSSLLNTTTTLPPQIFELSPTYQKLTVFYHCEPSLHHFSSSECPELGLISLFENPEHRKTCQANFTLNVPMSFVPNEKELNMTHLESVLREGFEVKVKIDENACEECLSSHERCGFNQSLPLEVKCGPLSPPRKDEDLSLGATAGIAVASVLGVVILIAAVLIRLIRRRRKMQGAQYKSKDLPISSYSMSLGRSHDLSLQNPKEITSHNLSLQKQDLEALIPLKQYSYPQVKRITNSFAEVVGKGGFGTVYKGTLCDGRIVAVKILKDSMGNNGEDFINEVASISKTSHVNIVSLLGFSSEGSKRAIIYEFLENGSLDKFISSKRSSNMDWNVLYGIALGVARGLEYLHHGCRTRIVHFDIKPQNVLLDDNLCPKVSDFGLAKLCEKKDSILSLLDTRGTIGYIAPEVFSRMYGRVSHKSDVYSYGMLVLEMIGARNKERAYQESASNTSSIYFPEWIYKDLEKGDNGRLIENGISSEEEGEIARKMTLVGLWCIQSSPTDRPPMNRVVEMMEGNLNALEVPPRPVLQQIPPALLQESSTLSDDISVYTEVCSMNVIA